MPVIGRRSGRGVDLSLGLEQVLHSIPVSHTVQHSGVDEQVKDTSEDHGCDGVDKLVSDHAEIPLDPSVIQLQAVVELVEDHLDLPAVLVGTVDRFRL